MIVELLSQARKLDDWLHARLGRPYQAFMGIGLTIELVKQIKELFGKGIFENGSWIPSGLALALFVALLIHSLAELSEHADQRFRRSKRRA